MTRINFCLLLNHSLDVLVRTETVVLENPSTSEKSCWGRLHNDYLLKLEKGSMKVKLRPIYTQEHEVAEKLTGKKLGFKQ